MRARARVKGPRAFGLDPERYDRIRPGYAPEVLTILGGCCHAGAGARVLEIGAGTGQMTRGLLSLGAGPITAVEPDPRLAAFLAEAASGSGRVEVVPRRFEDITLPDHAFDLAVAATSFHWLDAHDSLLAVRRALRPGGWWLACWHIFNDPTLDDPFRDATEALFREVGRVQQDDVKGARAFGLDREARSAELERAGFRRVSHRIVRETLTFDVQSICDLYATFSPVSTLNAEAGAFFLGELGKLVRTRFGGRVERPLLTPVYWACSP